MNLKPVDGKHLNQNAIKEILTKHEIVAVVGSSRAAGKDSHRVRFYLKQHRFPDYLSEPFCS
jgi:predicted CoA-binding protein